MDLDAIFQPVSDELELVEQELKSATARMADTEAHPGALGILPGIVTHPFAVPGKRIRPALVLLASRAVDGSFPRQSLIKLAAAVEVLHAASLVHDDIIDSAELRRHQVSLNKRFGDRVAVLAGDILYTHFFSLITALPAVSAERRFAILNLFLETTKAMCIGEIMAQEAAASGSPLPFKDYLEISSDKTASLFAACCVAAGMVVGADDAQLRSLKEFGLSFGLAFQMMDDLVDQDHGLDPSVDLHSEARSCAVKAHGIAGSFPKAEDQKRFGELIDYVMAQSIA